MLYSLLDVGRVHFPMPVLVGSLPQDAEREFPLVFAAPPGHDR
jgi:hypothetical protein